ncbi:MAG: hypothetical protein IJU65_10465, partial [Desulfovibrio sp.]|nr:hypothetical protein [Desulfovibrio sp.]
GQGEVGLADGIGGAEHLLDAVDKCILVLAAQAAAAILGLPLLLSIRWKGHIHNSIQSQHFRQRQRHKHPQTLPSAYQLMLGSLQGVQIA